METCQKCQGLGEVPSGYTDMWGRMTWRLCPACGGTGDEPMSGEEEATILAEIHADLDTLNANEAARASELDPVLASWAAVDTGQPPF